MDSVLAFSYKRPDSISASIWRLKIFFLIVGYRHHFTWRPKRSLFDGALIETKRRHLLPCTTTLFVRFRDIGESRFYLATKERSSLLDGFKEKMSFQFDRGWF